jgi:hypothetical protein
MTEYPKGWTCEVVVPRLEAYLLRILSFEESLAVAEHVEACPSCSQLVALQVEQRLSVRHG